jgi:mannose-6-phosphate isomerase class I
MEIWFCLRGEVRGLEENGAAELILTRGMSMIVPASVETYTLEGNAILYRASMGEIQGA